MAFISVALLAVAGFVIDSGTRARAQMNLQKAADAGVMAGLDYRISKGPGVNVDDVYKRTRAFIEQNLLLHNIDILDANLHIGKPHYEKDDPPPSGPNESLTVTIDYDVPYLFMPYVPLHLLGIPDTAKRGRVTVVARAVVPRSNIIMVLDTSNSMACPSDNPDCSCVIPGHASFPCNLDVPPKNGPRPPGTAKIFDLRDGVFTFLEEFRENKDRIALVSFDVVAKTLVNLDLNGFKKKDFEDSIGKPGQPLKPEFEPGGLTNPSDGLLTAYEEAKTAALFGKEKIAILFFTDGAPTAKDSCYSSTTAALDAGPATLGCPFVNNDGKRYTDIELEWVYPTGERLRGPSPLIPKQALLNIPKIDRYPAKIFENAAVVNSIPNCSCKEPVPVALPEAGFPVSDSEAVTKCLKNCLNDLSSYLPDATEDAAHKNQELEPLEKYKVSYYHRAESIAGFLRDNGVIILGVGVGPPSPTSADSDFYQDSANDFNRKDGFLKTLTNDTNMGDGIYDLATTPKFTPYTGFKSWEQRMQASENAKAGMYSKDADSANISSMFKAAAAEIKLRFVQ